MCFLKFGLWGLYGVVEIWGRILGLGDCRGFWALGCVGGCALLLIALLK